MSRRIRPVVRADRQGWLRLRIALWGEDARLDDLDRILDEPARRTAFFAIDENGTAVGFAEASLRVDYVNGTETSPVGFLEGLFVESAARQRGVGRALVAAVEDWTRSLDCRELASDALLDNTASHAAHHAYGFEETERVVYFRRRLSD